MRIVPDTNVVLSALLWRGSPYQLLQTIRQREDIKLFSSGLLLEELAKVQMLAGYAEVADLVTPIGAPRVIVDDPDDDHVVAAAIAAGADIIASGDQHLLGLRTYRQVRILSPADLLALISGKMA